MSDQAKAPVPEDLRRMAAEIVRVEAACIEWGATAERSIELVVEQLMILRTAEQAFAAERIALAESKLADAERRERGMREALEAYEKLDDFHANCPECDGMEQPEVCTKCFPLADDARLKMRAALAQKDPMESETKQVEFVPWRDGSGLWLVRCNGLFIKGPIYQVEAMRYAEGFEAGLNAERGEDRKR